jgi:hypothetical protein
METDAQRVRQVLARELETVSHYESLATAAERPEIRAFFQHLAEEEKEHIAEAAMVLRRLDSGQDAQFHKPFPASHFQPGGSTGAAAPRPSGGPSGKPITHARQAIEASPAPPSPHGSLTVGSLRGSNA